MTESQQSIARVSFISWNPPTRDLFDTWLTLIRNLWKANKRDPNVEILLLLSSEATFPSPSPSPLEKEEKSLVKPSFDPPGTSIGAQQHQQQQQQQQQQQYAVSEMEDKLVNLLKELDEEEGDVSDKMVAGNQLIRIFKVDDSRRKGFPVSRKLNLLVFKAQGTYIKFFTVNPRPGFPNHSSCGARDLRRIFDKNSQSPSGGSIAHLWQGSLIDEVEFSSFLISKALITALGGFGYNFSSPIQKPLQALLASGEVKENKGLRDIAEICFLYVQLCIHYDSFLKSYIGKRLETKHQHIIACRSVSHFSFPVFKELRINSVLQPIYLDRKQKENNRNLSSSSYSVTNSTITTSSSTSSPSYTVSSSTSTSSSTSSSTSNSGSSFTSFTHGRPTSTLAPPEWGSKEESKNHSLTINSNNNNNNNSNISNNASSSHPLSSLILSTLLQIETKDWKNSDLGGWLKIQAKTFVSQTHELNSCVSEYHQDFRDSLKNRRQGEQQQGADDVKFSKTGTSDLNSASLSCSSSSSSSSSVSATTSSYSLPPSYMSNSRSRRLFGAAGSNVVSFSSLNAWWSQHKADRKLEKEVLDSLRRETAPQNDATGVEDAYNDDIASQVGWIVSITVLVIFLVVAIVISSVSLSRVRELELKLKTGL